MMDFFFKKIRVWCDVSFVVIYIPFFKLTIPFFKFTIGYASFVISCNGISTYYHFISSCPRMVGMI